MIDLETLSTKNNAIILVIGAIKFNRNDKWNDKFKLENIHESKKFYKRIQISTCEKIGLHKDKKTEEWWAKQDEHIKQEAFGFESERISISDALKEFNKWFKGSTYVWGNGSIFDITILSEAYDRCNIEVPWRFWNVRDVRTILDIYNVNLNNFRDKDLHNAIYDCFYQIKALQHCFSKKI
jgi:hypothetical protein